MLLDLLEACAKKSQRIQTKEGNLREDIAQIHQTLMERAEHDEKTFTDHLDASHRILRKAISKQQKAQEQYVK